MIAYLFSLLLLVSVVNATTLEIPINDNVSYTYIDANNDGVFDSLIVKKTDTTINVLKQVESKPSKTDFNNAEFEVRLKNYNDTYKDAYFRINVNVSGKLIGFYEHNYGKKELIYRGVE